MGQPEKATIAKSSFRLLFKLGFILIFISSFLFVKLVYLYQTS